MIALSDKKGLEVFATGDDASTIVRNTDILDNAGYENTSAPLGGVAIHSNTPIDLGNDGSTDKGLNRLCCNKNGTGSSDRQIHNKSGLSTNARGNYWCNVTPAVLNQNGSSTNVDNIQSDSSLTCTSR